MDFNRIGSYPFRSPDLITSGIDKEADKNATLLKALDRFFKGLKGFYDIETSLGRQFFPPFRNESNNVWFGGQGDPDHFLGSRHLQIQSRLNDLS
jgi:hypothetical protein